MKRILILIGLFLTLGWRCYEKFSISGLQSFLSHLKAYELRAASIFLVTVTIGLIHVIPLKKNLILRVLPFWWNILTILALFIYPITSDFANRFGKLTTENGAEFLAVILPVFLMMGVLSSLPSP